MSAATPPREGTPEHWAAQLLKMYPQAFPGGMPEALAFAQKNGVGVLPNSTAAPPPGQATAAMPAGQGQQATPVTHTDPRSVPAGVQGSQPGGKGTPVVVQPQRQFAGIEGDPGREKFAADDKYGKGMRVNTNQVGVQSNGDDDPWSIGAFEGGTYIPQVVAAWRQRAKQGDPAALHLMSQIGMTPQISEEEWAASRGLQTREQAFAAGGKYYRDPVGPASAAPPPAAPASTPVPQNGNKVADPTQPGNTSKPPLNPDPNPQTNAAANAVTAGLDPNPNTNNTPSTQNNSSMPPVAGAGTNPDDLLRTGGDPGGGSAWQTWYRNDTMDRKTDTGANPAESLRNLVAPKEDENPFAQWFR